MQFNRKQSNSFYLVTFFTSFWILNSIKSSNIVFYKTFPLIFPSKSFYVSTQSFTDSSKIPKLEKALTNPPKLPSNRIRITIIYFSSWFSVRLMLNVYLFFHSHFSSRVFRALVKTPVSTKRGKMWKI